MKHSLFIIAILAAFISVLDASPKEEYLALLKKGDYTALAVQLDGWHKAEPENPEVYIGFFNLHLGLAMKSGIGLDTVLTSDAKQYMTLTDPKTGKVVGYMHNKTIYEESETQKALSYLDQGLVFGPDRLDMYFGKTHVLMEIHDYDNAVSTLLLAFSRIATNNNAWLWSDNKPIENGEKFLVENIQDYYNTWFREKSKESLQAVESLAKQQVIVFPNHSWGYANLATALAWQKSTEDPLPYLQKAVDLDPNDLVNVNNLANYFRVHGNMDLARKYYQIIANGPDVKYAEYAKKVLSDLGK